MINSAFSVPKEPLKSAFLAATYLYANNAVRKWEKNSSWYVRYVEWVLIEKDSSSLFRKKWNMGTQGSGLLRRIFYRTSIWREDDQMLSYLFKIPSFANFWKNSFLCHLFFQKFCRLNKVWVSGILNDACKGSFIHNFDSSKVRAW